MNPIRSLRIDNQPKELGVFAVPEMDLSSARARMLPHAFTITTDAESLVSFLERTYEDWVAESKKDDELCGGPQDELAEAGYPKLRQVLENPSLLSLVVGGYLLQDFLGKLMWDGSSPIEYWLDTVDDCSSDGHIVRLSGICYSKAD